MPIEIKSSVLVRNRPGTRRAGTVVFTAKIVTTDGQTIRRDVGTDEAKAYRALVALEEQVRAGRLLRGRVGAVAIKPITFSDVCAACLKFGGKRTGVSSAATIRIQSAFIARWLEIVGADTPWRAVDEDVLRHAIVEFRALTNPDGSQRYGANSVAQAVTVLKKVVRFGEGYRAAGPPRGIAAAFKTGDCVQTKTRERYLTRDEVDRMLAHVQRHAAHDIFAQVLTLADCGLRVGESSALRWRCVDLEGEPSRLTVEITVGSMTTKTGKVRAVKLTSRLRAALSRLRLLQGPAATPDALVFPTSAGTEMRCRAAFSKALRSGGESIGVAGLHPHLLRHSLASNLLAEGASPKATADRLGMTVPTLLTTYIHASQRDADALIPDEIHDHLRVDDAAN